MGRSSDRNKKNFREVLRDRLIDDKPKEGDWSRRKGPWEFLNDWSRDLITEKDRDRTKKDKDLLNAFLKILLTHNIKSSNKQTTHHPTRRQN
jgi:hypothetical protein